MRKSQTGRELNGRTYDDMPALAHESHPTRAFALPILAV